MRPFCSARCPTRHERHISTPRSCRADDRGRARAAMRAICTLRVLSRWLSRIASDTYSSHRTESEVCRTALSVGHLDSRARREQRGTGHLRLCTSFPAEGFRCRGAGGRHAMALDTHEGARGTRRRRVDGLDQSSGIACKAPSARFTDQRLRIQRFDWRLNDRD